MPKDLQVISRGNCSIVTCNKAVSGIQRVGQRFLIELLTASGSMQYLPKRGCLFLTRIRKRAESEFDVILAFASSKPQLKKILRINKDFYTTPDEKYKDAHIDKIIINTTGLQVSFRVYNEANQSIRVTTPVLFN